MNNFIKKWHNTTTNNKNVALKYNLKLENDF